MIKREQIADSLKRRISYEWKECKEKNDPKYEIYEEQLMNLEDYVDEYLANSINEILNTIGYIPGDRIYPTGRTSEDGKPIYKPGAGYALEIENEEYGEFYKNHSPNARKAFIAKMNEFYGINMPTPEEYKEAMVQAHMDPTEENLSYYADVQRRNGDFVNWEGLSILPRSKDALLGKTNNKSK